MFGDLVAFSPLVSYVSVALSSSSDFEIGVSTCIPLIADLLKRNDCGFSALACANFDRWCLFMILILQVRDARVRDYSMCSQDGSVRFFYLRNNMDELRYIQYSILSGWSQ